MFLRLFDELCIQSLRVIDELLRSGILELKCLFHICLGSGQVFPFRFPLVVCIFFASFARCIFAIRFEFHFSVHSDTVIDVHVSEDELRYQPQMSLSPTNDFPHANCQSRRKKSEQNNGQEILQKIVSIRIIKRFWLLQLSLDVFLRPSMCIFTNYSAFESLKVSVSSFSNQLHSFTGCRSLLVAALLMWMASND